MSEEGLRIDRLFADDFQIVAYRDLPETHQLAIAWYMAVDGEAWDFPQADNGRRIPNRGDCELTWHAACQKALRDSLPVYIDEHGDTPFGIANVATEQMLQSIGLDDAIVEDGENAETFRAVCERGPARTAYPPHQAADRWPVILSSNDEETLQDGWKRFTTYVWQGATTIPAVFYPRDRHFTAPPALGL